MGRGHRRQSRFGRLLFERHEGRKEAFTVFAFLHEADPWILLRVRAREADGPAFALAQLRFVRVAVKNQKTGTRAHLDGGAIC